MCAQAEDAESLRPERATDEQLEAHAAACRLAHALLLRASPQGRHTAVIARRAAP